MSKGLSHNKKLEVAKRLAQFGSSTEATKFVKDTWGIQISNQAINQTFLKKGTRWNKILIEMRDVYLSASMEEPIAHRRVRLKRYDELYKAAKDEGKISAAKACLDSAREEFAGAKTPSIGSILFAQINNMSDDQLKREQQTLLNKLEGIRPRIQVIDAEDNHAKQGNQG